MLEQIMFYKPQNEDIKINNLSSNIAFVLHFIF